MLQDAHQQRQAPDAAPRASVIIRTKNEAKDLADTLTGVFTQVPPPHQVIVIDSGSTDGTMDIARRFPITALHIPPEEWGYSRAINRAAEHATGEILVYLSAHCRPVTEHWLDSLCRPFADPLVAGVWGPGLRPDRDTFSPGPAQRQLPGTYTAANRMWGLTNANSAVRRSLWSEVPFDESIPATEDKAWGRAMLDRGLVIVHEPAAAVWHEAHTVAHEYRRNLAVQAGFRQMFPELDDPYATQVGLVARRAGAILTSRVRRRDLAGLWNDLKRLPRVVSALTGGIVGIRPSRWRARRATLPRPEPVAQTTPALVPAGGVIAPEAVAEIDLRQGEGARAILADGRVVEVALVATEASDLAGRDRPDRSRAVADGAAAQAS